MKKYVERGEGVLTLTKMDTKFGPWLRDRIIEKGITIKEFAAEVNMSESRLRAWLALAAPRVRPEIFARVAGKLGMTLTELANKYYEITGQRVIPPTNVRKATAFELHSVQRVPIINKIAASKLKEYTDLGYPGGIADDYIRLPVGTDPHFAMWVDGDCMAPKYENGDLVVFRAVKLDEHELNEGGDYAIQLDGAEDGEATFKRLFRGKHWPRTVEARAINKAAGIKPFEIAVSSIIRLGIVRLVIPRPNAS